MHDWVNKKKKPNKYKPMQKKTTKNSCIFLNDPDMVK